MSEQRKWFETYDNVTTLGRWLREEGLIRNVGELQYYYEKPWKWTPEWHQMLEAERKVKS